MGCGRGDDDCLETPSSSNASPSQPDLIDSPTFDAYEYLMLHQPLIPELQAAVQAACAACRRDKNHFAALKEVLDAAVDTFRQTNMEAWREEAASAMQRNAAPTSCSNYETLQKPLVPNIQADSGTALNMLDGDKCAKTTHSNSELRALSPL